MPRNASGTYSLPIAAYISGSTIKSSDMNSNLSDIGTALTQSLATTGVSSMTGPVKLAAGSAAAPSLTLASDTTTGWYNSAAGTWVFVSATVAILTLSASGAQLNSGQLLDSSGNPLTPRLLGEVVDYAGSSAPSLWLLCYGQAISRATYSALFAVTGTAFGVGDGLTTFNIPDLRGRITAGKDNMGGATAGRITVAGGNFDATVLGAVGGAQNHVQTTGELATHTHTVTDPGHTHPNVITGGGSATKAAGADSCVVSLTTGSSGSNTTGITNQNTGSSTAFTIVPPVQIMNKIIYVGV